MLDKITRIINTWDPIHIKNATPEDEYKCEIEEVIEFINKNKKLDIALLSNEIDKIFIKWFGNNIYKSDKKVVLKIAQQIVEECKL